ncbi:hypothetical protein AAGU66_11155 [Edwardsiella ictaluri]|nr:hypothetical protein [Edwardsiella ictaluri]UCQ46748.1 hypothetical protein DB741_11805 [Edwardsiella ictaluri]UCQ50013.1 hypothetical protein DB731_11785 [Edwardsiella ictaluri]WFO12308.1 hypothetical protein MAY82_14500 [Edwardsiella ictaluri]BEH99539.1 hypothetical protein KH20906_22670 [Edwardsiella ictaluri]BEI03027.1 hypothetical protein KB20921_22880 [Edwardsiella ictaluri]
MVEERRLAGASVAPEMTPGGGPGHGLYQIGVIQCLYDLCAVIYVLKNDKEKRSPADNL